MDINQKLKQRRVKIEIEKKHKKASVMKKYYKELPENQKSSSGENTQKQGRTMDEILQKYKKTEEYSKMGVNDNSNIQQSTGNRINTGKGERKERKEGKESSKSVSNDQKEGNKGNKFASDKRGDRSNQFKEKKFATKEEFQRHKKQQFSKLSRKNSKGQPILKNKIEFLYKKILNTRKN
mmetsp:Transcript_32749/g.34083  ORF Transcript_32749/g.34083 Transcript_32749/m.34083 type:complete len:180 (+) Transcript_32749:17-556(+)